MHACQVALRLHNFVTLTVFPKLLTLFEIEAFDYLKVCLNLVYVHLDTNESERYSVLVYFAINVTTNVKYTLSKINDIRHTQVIESFVRHQEHFPVLLKRHLTKIEEQIVEHRVWQRNQAPEALYLVGVGGLSR